jgi:FdhD protein
MASIETKVQRFELDKGVIEDREDKVAADAAICIFINGEHFRTLLTSPVMVKELVIGHLFCEGIIDSTEDMVSLDIMPLKVHVELEKDVDIVDLTQWKADLITTACGTVSSPSELQGLGLPKIARARKSAFEAEKIWLIARKLNIMSDTYRETGGTHAALLSSIDGEYSFFAEDVGRHNAVDKVIGAAVLTGVDFEELILVSSGRLSGEIVVKAAKMKIPLIASVSGPIESGLRIAESVGITLVGFIRGRRMNIYTHIERIGVTCG